MSKVRKIAPLLVGAGMVLIGCTDNQPSPNPTVDTLPPYPTGSVADSTLQIESEQESVSSWTMVGEYMVGVNQQGIPVRIRLADGREVPIDIQYAQIQSERAMSDGKSRVIAQFVTDSYTPPIADHALHPTFEQLPEGVLTPEELSSMRTRIFGNRLYLQRSAFEPGGPFEVLTTKSNDWLTIVPLDMPILLLDALPPEELAALYAFDPAIEQIVENIKLIRDSTAAYNEIINFRANYGSILGQMISSGTSPDGFQLTESELIKAQIMYDFLNQNSTVMGLFDFIPVMQRLGLYNRNITFAVPHAVQNNLGGTSTYIFLSGGQISLNSRRIVGIFVDGNGTLGVQEETLQIDQYKRSPENVPSIIDPGMLTPREDPQGYIYTSPGLPADLWHEAGHVNQLATGSPITEVDADTYMFNQIEVLWNEWMDFNQRAMQGLIPPEQFPSEFERVIRRFPFVFPQPDGSFSISSADTPGTRGRT